MNETEQRQEEETTDARAEAGRQAEASAESDAPEAEIIEGEASDSDASTGAADDASESDDDLPRPPPPIDFKQRRIDELTKQVAAKDETLRTYIKAHKKAEAEFEAFKERMKRDREEELERAKGKIVGTLFDVADNLERSLSAGGDATQLREGLVLVHRLFTQRLVEMGLQQYDPAGEVFDPTSMEAIGMIPVSDRRQDNRVVNTLQTGYRIGTTELRPAIVQVGRYSG